MELKATEKSTKRYIANHFLSTAIYLLVVLAPGLVYRPYYAILGPVVFCAIIFFAARCDLQAFFAVRMPPLEELPEEQLPRVS